MKSWTMGIIGVLALTALAGCNSNASVTGMVTAGGETVDGGSIVFRPLAEGVKPAIGKINADGGYSLVTAGNGGVQPGEYQVMYMPPDQKEDEAGRALGPPVKWRKFRAPSSPVSVDSGENDIPITLEKT
ncbi:hypothetical protein Pan97_25840 [Bremerella volcania]|uniref:Carboxypeptidase regulatory-like domain-containing protein n=1 Tax=Bremerella volcania TaxID=2527984 RepID=A0A518C8K6_9BACT|nr:hypothetical protein [Bremerella volcania]QDU75551.1 hypothetical protein Pan97_25840 [Bremerella volcania]